MMLQIPCKKINHLGNKGLVLLAFLLVSSSAFMQSTISGLEENGVKKTQLEITVARPRQAPEKKTVKVNDQFESGTIFVVPGNAVVWLSGNGNNQRLGPGSKHMASAGARGESHQTFWGEVTHFVKNKLNFYTASGPSDKLQGAVQGTVFTVTSSGRDVNIKTQEGQVACQQKVPLNIAENAQSKRAKEHDLETIRTSYVNAGYDHTYNHGSNEAVTYASYAEAIAAFRQELDALYDNDEPAENLVEHYSLLGELYLDSGDWEGAVDSFETAIGLYLDELDPEDPMLADNYLGLVEAHLMANDEEARDENWDKAVDFLLRDMENNEMDFNYFISIEDYDTAWGIGWSFVDNLDNLGWAYDLVSDPEQSEKFYALAREIEKELE